MADKYVPQEPPSNIDPALAQYLSSELHRIANGLHLSYREIMGGSDAGPYAVPVAPAEILIASFTIPVALSAGAQWFFEGKLENTNNQLDTCEYDVEVGGVRDQFLSQMVDQTSFAFPSATGFLPDAVPAETVINFYASAVKRTGLIHSDTNLWFIEG